MKFAFIAKHRGIWPARWLCGALGVSRGGFYGWLTRPRSARARRDEELSAKVRASFLASDPDLRREACLARSADRWCVMRTASDRAADVPAGLASQAATASSAARHG